MDDSKLAIITVVYENYDILDDFLKSLANQKDKNFHLYISDLSKTKKKIPEQKFAMTITQGENKGYSHGINISMAKAIDDGMEKFCVINNDTFFKPEFVYSVKNSLDKYSGSIVGGKIYYASGYEYHKDRYEKKDLGKVIWYAGGKIDWNHAWAPHRGVDEVDKGQYDSIDEVNFVTGALMCFDKSVYDAVGPWDESYFLYYEDSDWCVRASKKGLKFYYDPAIIIWHKVSQSTEGSGSKLHDKYQTKNRLKFGLKYAPLRTKLHLIKNYILK